MAFGIASEQLWTSGIASEQLWTSADSTTIELLKEALEKGTEIKGEDDGCKYLIPNKEILGILYDYLLDKDFIKQAEAIIWLQKGTHGAASGKENDYWWTIGDNYLCTVPDTVNFGPSKCSQPSIYSAGPLPAFLWLLENWR